MSQLPPTEREARKRYFETAAAWSADVNGSLRASRRAGWIVAAVALLVAALEALALAALAPLKTVVPLAITVDRQTGYVETQASLKPGALSQNQAVTQSYLVRYVMAREGFDATDLTSAYHRVMLWSAGDARAQYDRLMHRATPESPLNLYTAATQLSVTIESVSLLTPTTALVRFITTRREASGPAGPPQYWATAMAFRYSDAPMSMADRFINPLGFQVTRYRRDSETPAVDIPPPAPPASGALVR